jgi:hypothetical protein
MAFSDPKPTVDKTSLELLSEKKQYLAALSTLAVVNPLSHQFKYSPIKHWYKKATPKSG